MNKFIVLLFLCICSCSKYNPEINKALDLAGDNKEELLKVLIYYENKGNAEKIKAAEFLIKNLPYNYSYDTTNLHKYRIVYKTIDSIKKSNTKLSLNTTVNKFWDSLKTYKNPYQNIYNKSVIPDIKVIKSDFLINNIDQAFTAWKSNPYAKDSVNFEIFCEYILPYRLIQGKSIENWRTFFTQNSKNHLSDLYPIPFTQACDSLFSQYSHYKFNYSLAEGLPIMKFKDFMSIKEGKCTVKSWFNTYVVNAEGMPMVADFVPAWGTREDDHQWNAILYGGKTLYFESYWEANHSWTYNPNINNNLFNDDWSGKIRLPKVYRHTFSTYIEGPISDKRILIGDIPILFRNIKKKDVSDEYFKTIDIKFDLKTNPPENTYYAYLCVLGVNKQWVPVQWGKIDGSSVKFDKMGTDIVYQVVFYKNDSIIPFGNPFHINHNGLKKEFNAGKPIQEIIVNRKYPAKRGLEKEAKLIKGSLIQASNSSDFKNFETLNEINFEPELRPYEVNTNFLKKYRYYRLFSKNKITIRNIQALILDAKGNEILLKGDTISKPSTETDSTNWIGIDLGKSIAVTKIKYEPLNNLNHVLKDLTYELFYIDKGVFVSLGIKKATSSHDLKYNDVPSGTLLYLKCLDEGRQERIFEYKDGDQVWY